MDLEFFVFLGLECEGDYGAQILVVHVIARLRTEQIVLLFWEGYFEGLERRARYEIGYEAFADRNRRRRMLAVLVVHVVCLRGRVVRAVRSERRIVECLGRQGQIVRMHRQQIRFIVCRQLFNLVAHIEINLICKFILFKKYIFYSHNIYKIVCWTLFEQKKKKRLKL